MYRGHLNIYTTALDWLFSDLFCRIEPGCRGNDSLPSENEKEEYIYFSRKDSVFSQWYPCTFVIDDKEYNCAEQYMMYTKAGSLYYLCRVIFLNQNCQSKSCSDFI